jgi:ketosteroid isomerase-like protein
MNKDEVKKYYEAYNRGDLEAMSVHYSDDVIFEARIGKYIGKDPVVNFFKEFRKYFDESLNPVSILVDGDKIAVEVDNKIKVKVDDAEFLGKIYKAGDSINRRICVFYDIRDTKICHIRVYRFKD